VGLQVNSEGGDCIRRCTIREMARETTFPRIGFMIDSHNTHGKPYFLSERELVKGCSLCMKNRLYVGNLAALPPFVTLFSSLQSSNRLPLED
jgi:hypothetical protein